MPVNFVRLKDTLSLSLVNKLVGLIYGKPVQPSAQVLLYKPFFNEIIHYRAFHQDALLPGL